ncbi:MAG: mercury resistance system periplasmic binding protein MerP [Gammaproteobacteria bacterium]|nr:mercury resistance system periplasmic binding protein MerP [Gammaproteobacteria bacterium]
MKIKLLSLITVFLMQPLFAAEQSVTLDIQNMTCAMCPITVKKSLTNIEGVSQVAVSFENKTAKVSYDDALTTTDVLTAATTNAGYPSTVHKDKSSEEAK